MGGFCRGGYSYEQSQPYAPAQPGCGGIQGAAYEAWGPSTVVAYDNVTKPGYENLIAGPPFNGKSWDQALNEATQKGLPIVAVVGSWKDNPGRLTRDLLPHLKGDAVYVYIDKDNATGEAARIAQMCNPNRDNVISAVFTPKPGPDGKPLIQPPTYNLLGADQSNIATFSQVLQDSQTLMKRLWPEKAIPPIPPAKDDAPQPPVVPPKAPDQVPPKSDVTPPPKTDGPAPPVVAPPPKPADPNKALIEQMKREKEELQQKLDQQRLQNQQQQQKIEEELAKLRKELADAKTQLGEKKPAEGPDKKDKNRDYTLADVVLSAGGGAAAALGLRALWNYLRSGKGGEAPPEAKPYKDAFKDAKEFVDDRINKFKYTNDQRVEVTDPEGKKTIYDQKEFDEKFTKTSEGECRSKAPVFAVQLKEDVKYKDGAGVEKTAKAGEWVVLGPNGPSVHENLNDHARVYTSQNGKRSIIVPGGQEGAKYQDADGKWQTAKADECLEIDLATNKVTMMKNDAAKAAYPDYVPPAPSTADSGAPKPAAAAEVKPGDKITLPSGEKVEVAAKVGDNVVLKGDKPASAATPVKAEGDYAKPDPNVWEKMPGGEEAEGLYFNKKDNKVYDLKRGFEFHAETGTDSFAGWQATPQDNFKCVPQADLKLAAPQSPTGSGNDTTQPPKDQTSPKPAGPDATKPTEPAVGQEKTINGKQMVVKDVAANGTPIFMNKDGNIIAAMEQAPINLSDLTNPIKFNVEVNGKTETFVAEQGKTTVYRQLENGTLEKIARTSMIAVPKGEKLYESLYPQPKQEQPKPGPTDQPKPGPTEQPKPGPTEQPKPGSTAPESTQVKLAEVFGYANKFDTLNPGAFDLPAFKQDFARYVIEHMAGLRGDPLFQKLDVAIGQPGQKAGLIFRDASGKEFTPLYRDRDPATNKDEFVKADGTRVKVAETSVTAQISAEEFQKAQSADKAVKDPARQALEREFGSSLMELDQISSRKARLDKALAGLPAEGTKVTEEMQKLATADAQAKDYAVKVAAGLPVEGAVPPSELVTNGQGQGAEGKKGPQFEVRNGQVVLNDNGVIKPAGEDTPFEELNKKAFDQAREDIENRLKQAKNQTEIDAIKAELAQHDKDVEKYNTDPVYRQKVLTVQAAEAKSRYTKFIEFCKAKGKVIGTAGLVGSFFLFSAWAMKQANDA